MKHTYLWILGVVLVAGMLFFVFGSGNKVTAPALENQSGTTADIPDQTIPTNTTAGDTPTPMPPVVGFTAAQVATHNSATSCYSIIRNAVYDLTAFIGKHPGGNEAILRICGTDGTAAFTGKHGGSPKQEAMLETMKIGVFIAR